ncbi:MAG TPA: hypothetical protein VNE21_09510 [Mycobacteriales bacterium]|nr:hypothetical protein [Mycobacteriales bacterium]
MSCPRCAALLMVAVPSCPLCGFDLTPALAPAPYAPRQSAPVTVPAATTPPVPVPASEPALVGASTDSAGRAGSVLPDWFAEGASGWEPSDPVAAAPAAPPAPAPRTPLTAPPVAAAAPAVVVPPWVEPVTARTARAPRSVPRWALIALPLTVVVALVGGYLDLHHSTPAPTPAVVVVPAPMTKAAYLRAGNAICTRMQSQIKALGPVPTGARLALATYTTKAVAVDQVTLGQLERLRRPATDTTRLGLLYNETAGVLTTARQLAATLRTGTAAAAGAALTRLATQTAALNEDYDSYGLGACAN